MDIVSNIGMYGLLYIYCKITLKLLTNVAENIKAFTTNP